MKRKIIIIFIIIYLVTINISIVNADLLQDIISEGNKFENRGNDAGLGKNIAKVINGDVKSIVSLIGNLAFAGITVILGVKYIWSGIEGKSQVKETLPTFIAAVLFFYLAVELTNMFSPMKSGSIGSSISNIKNYDSLAGTIIATINTIVKYLAFGGVIFIGLKYMFESAEGKAQIKDKLAPMVLGIMLVFSASSIVDFIIAIGQQAIQ